MGNVTMMLEAGEKEPTDDDRNDKTQQDMNTDETIQRVTTKTIGERDPLRHTKRTELVKTQNKYKLLDGDDDDDDETHAEIGVVTDDEGGPSTTLHSTKHRLDKRQRLRRQRQRLQIWPRYSSDEAIRDAAAEDGCNEDEWQAITYNVEEEEQTSDEEHE